MKKVLGKVEILGREAMITSIDATAGDEKSIWNKEDQLTVWLDFGDEPLGNVISFAATLPAKKYGKDELFALIVQRGEDEMKESLACLARERQAREVKEKRQKELDTLATELAEEDDQWDIASISAAPAAGPLRTTTCRRTRGCVRGAWRNE